MVTREQAETEIQKLIALLNDSSCIARRSAVQALGKLGAKEAIPYLIDLLKDPDEDVRYATIVALGKLGEENSTDTRVQKVKQLEGQ